jgi:molybdopterin-binding protein
MKVISSSGESSGVKCDGLMAQITIVAGDHELTSLITADAAAELGLSTGDKVIALLNPFQIMYPPRPQLSIVARMGSIERFRAPRFA